MCSGKFKSSLWIIYKFLIGETNVICSFVMEREKNYTMHGKYIFRFGQMFGRTKKNIFDYIKDEKILMDRRFQGTDSKTNPFS